jgi:glucose-like phosphotransferase system IIB component
VADNEIRERAQSFIEALGGADNIEEIEGCITRLRGTLKDPARVDLARLQKLKIMGRPIVMGGGIQVVVGTHAELIGTEMNDILRGK